MKTVSDYGPNDPGDISKLSFALKAAGMHPAVLPEEVIAEIRAEVSELVDGSNGMLHLEPSLIDTIRSKVVTCMNSYLNPA